MADTAGKSPVNMMALRKNERQRSFKKGIDSDATRRRREDTTVQIRKTRKEDRLNQRRRMDLTANDSPTDESQRGVHAAGVSVSDLPKIAAMVQSLDPEEQTIATSRLRRLLSLEHNPPIQEVVNLGVVPLLVTFLRRHERPELQFEAAWALTNIASGTSSHTEAVVHSGAVPVLCELLLSSNDDVSEQAVWALGNISGDSPQFRDHVLNAGVMMPLLAVLRRSQNKMSLLRNATWTLSNLCRGKPKPDLSLVSPALNILPHLIHSTDEEVVTDACWTLSYLSDGSQESVQTVLDAGIGRRLIDLLTSPLTAIQTPALRTAGNIVTGNESQTQAMLDLGLLYRIVPLLKHEKKLLRKEACWAISNITAGSPSQMQEVLEAGIIPLILHQLTTGEFEVQKEAAWAIANGTSGGDPSQIELLVQEGCIAPMVRMLDCNDPKIINVCLDALENILRVGESTRESGGENKMALFMEEAEGVDRIQGLQFHQEEDIYEKALRIIELYFNGEDDDDLVGAPVADAENREFAFGTTEDASVDQTFDFNL